MRSPHNERSQELAPSTVEKISNAIRRLKKKRIRQFRQRPGIADANEFNLERM
jgi:hypothetical protein